MKPWHYIITCDNCTKSWMQPKNYHKTHHNKLCIMHRFCRVSCTTNLNFLLEGITESRQKLIFLQCGTEIDGPLSDVHWST